MGAVGSGRAAKCVRRKMKRLDGFARDTPPEPIQRQPQGCQAFGQGRGKLAPQRGHCLFEAGVFRHRPPSITL